jgi:hypothetical protein
MNEQGKITGFHLGLLRGMEYMCNGVAALTLAAAAYFSFNALSGNETTSKWNALACAMGAGLAFGFSRGIVRSERLEIEAAVSKPEPNATAADAIIDANGFIIGRGQFTRIVPTKRPFFG